MLSRFVTIRDRNLSLWQSAVEEVVAKIDDPARRKEMRQAAALHILSETKDAAIPDTPPASAAEVENDRTRALAYLSKKLFDHANAEQSASGRRSFSVGDLRSFIRDLRSLGTGEPGSLSISDVVELLRNKLPDLVRSYSTADIAGWSQCIIAYVQYLASGSGEPHYEDWKNKVPPDPNYGVLDYRLPDNGKVVMIGDWGSHMTDNVAMLRQALERFKPDAIIHLGDVYYSGTAFECKRNVLDVMDSLIKELGIKRPPFFTIPGNHEYYSGGAGFYEMIGKVNAGTTGAQQQASYFCLRTANDKWQFLGMDTGFNDRIPGLSVEGPALQASEAEWHTHKLSTFPGSTILLSHHQLFSANSAINKSGARRFVNEKLLETFSPFFDRIAAWYWGHEHNLVIFKDDQFGLKRGRLLGCGAYESAAKEDPYKINFPEVAYIDPMPRLEFSSVGGDGGLVPQKFYNHAFALLELSPQQLDVTYYQYPSWDRDFTGALPALSPDPFHRETIAPPR